MKKRKCFTCDGKGYFYSQPMTIRDGKLINKGKKVKIICPNCTANKS